MRIFVSISIKYIHCLLRYCCLLNILKMSSNSTRTLYTATWLGNTVSPSLLPDFAQQITTYSIPWTTTFMWNPSQTSQTYSRHSQTSCVQETQFIPPRYCAAWGTLAKSSGCQWWLFGKLTVCQICCLPFLF